MENYGILSLIPPLLAIGLAWWTKNVLISLLLGIFSGAFLLNNFNLLDAFLRTFDKYILASLADSWNASIIILILALGGMVGIITKSGGISSLSKFIASKAEGIKKTQFAVWMLGIAIFYDDYSNTLIVGNTMRPLTDKFNISREKLAYITDTTAAAVVSIFPISTWLAYEVGLIRDAFSNIGVEQSAYLVFVQSIPYRFYSIFALILVLIIIKSNKEFGPMYDAEVRARNTGKVIRDGATPLASKELTEMEVSEESKMTFIEAFVPILVLIIVTFMGLWLDGGGASGTSFVEAFGSADVGAVLLWASFSSGIVAAIFAFIRGGMNMEEIMDAWVDGAKSMVTACFLLILAWGIGTITSELGTAQFVIKAATGTIPAFIIPGIVFILGAFIAFTTGSSWGSMAILMPLAIPLAHSLGAPMVPTIAAVLTGSIFGDHSSPLSDTTIMSSMASASDHMDHVKTQLPYALLGAGLALIIGFIPAGLGVPAYILLPVGIVIMYLLFNKIGKDIRVDLKES